MQLCHEKVMDLQPVTWQGLKTNVHQPTLYMLGPAVLHHIQCFWFLNDCMLRVMEAICYIAVDTILSS